MAGTRYTVDLDGDVEMSIPHPIFEVIKAPELFSWEHAALVEWLREWERYEEKMRTRCATTGETFENVVSTVKGAVKRGTLKNLATYVLKKEVEFVTDADIIAAVKARCQSLKNGFVPDVTTLLRQRLKMNLAIEDCDARIFRYYEDFNSVVEDNGLQGLIGAGQKDDGNYKSRMKARCRLLIDNLQPPVLKAQISRLVDLERRDCKSDDVALFDLILEHAKVQQRFYRMSQEHASKVDSKGMKAEKRPQRAASSKPPPSRTSAQAAAASGGTAPPPPRPSRAPPRDGCLVCKGAHWMNDCPVATDAQREEALKQFREAKEKRSSARSKAARFVTPAGSVRINGLLEVRYLPDTGADRSIVPQSIMDSLLAVQPLLSTASLCTPVMLEMADGRQLECTKEALLDLELSTIAGPVMLRSVSCLVIEGESDELLLGRDVLKGLGIDVEQQLAQLAGPPLLDAENDEFPVGDEISSTQQSQETLDNINTLTQLLDRAVANGLPAEHGDAVRELLEAFPDVWREDVGADPPANVDPLQITIQPGAVPHRSPPRKYAPMQAQFIRDYVKSLVDSGLVEQNNASRWACAVVPVRKPGTQDKFRLTIDYRPVNKVTVPIAGTMPSAATMLNALEGMKVFGRVDFTQGFWQLPLHEDSREVFSFVTPDGVYTPMRVPQGAMDSALHFQSQVQAKLAPLIPKSALVWVDDVILFAPTIPEFLDTLRVFFGLVQEANFKLNAAKSSLFELEIKWCGRLISSEGIRHDPERVSALAELPLPSTIAELQYFVCATNWLHDSLPDYARLIAPLQDKLNAERSRIGRRNRNALNVTTSWTSDEQTAFSTVVNLVRDSALMAFPDPAAEMLLFTDASAAGYSIVVTQVRHWDPLLPVDQQHHEMIVCKGGIFKHSEENWSVVEKEAFPIVKACHDLEYLLLRPRGFRLYCDHANLAYIFAPGVELKKHVRDRLQRWSMRLCGLNYVIEHIPGEKNVWADIVSRWHARDVVRVAAVRTRSQHATPVEDLSRLRPLGDDNFVFPTRDDVLHAQEEAARERSTLPNFAEEDGMVTVDGRLWIPTAAKELLTRIFVVAHCGAHGHRGQEPMVLVIKERFFIARLEVKVAKFVRECLLCKHFKGPRLISRPYGPLLTPTQRNEIVHWDFLTLGEGFEDTKYLLVVKDGLSHFCELFPCTTPTAYIAAESLSMWCARYGTPKMLRSDQGSHFRNEVVKHLAARLKVELDFTPVYSPWLNGTVERLNKDVLQVARALLLEYSLDSREWPYLVPAIQANLNHTPVHSLAGHAPIEVFIALPAMSALDTIVLPVNGDRSERVVDLNNVGDSVDRIRSSLHDLHREVTDERERQRLRDMASHKGNLANFDVGDFVLWSRIDQRLPNHKLLGHWIGPFGITAALPHSFEIGHLITGRKYEVHASRLKFYADSELNVTEELLELVANQGMLIGVEEFVDHRFNSTSQRWELLVSWLGLQAIENSWEPLTTLLQDVPEKVHDYVMASEDDELRDQVD